MVYNIDQLPDDIVSYIFSFLSVRDAFRARMSSLRWLHLPDPRCDLQFDSLSVFGKEIWYHNRLAVESRFLEIVDSFMENWAGEKIKTLVVKFSLKKEHASHIDRWIATSVGMKVEEIELDFFDISEENYVFPSHIIHFGKATCLKRLCLKSCTLSISFEYTSWVSNLTTLELSRVPLRERGMDLILSAGSNLLSLGLEFCNLPKYMWIDGQLPCLKKLTICDHLSEVKLNCPSLEVFEYNQRSARSIVFVHVPVLRKAKLLPTLKPGWFDHITRQAPQLEALCLRIMTEVQPQMSTLARSGLKQLEIVIPFGFDLLSVTRLLDACPFLETLHLLLFRRTGNTRIGNGEYRDRPHFKLKEVKIERFYIKWNLMELTIYLLKNALVLEQLVLEVPENRILRENVMSLKSINPTAKVIIL